MAARRKKRSGALAGEEYEHARQVRNDFDAVANVATWMREAISDVNHGRKISCGEIIRTLGRGERLVGRMDAHLDGFATSNSHETKEALHIRDTMKGYLGNFRTFATAVCDRKPKKPRAPFHL